MIDAANFERIQRRIKRLAEEGKLRAEESKEKRTPADAR